MKTGMIDKIQHNIPIQTKIGLCLKQKKQGESPNKELTKTEAGGPERVRIRKDNKKE